MKALAMHKETCNYKWMRILRHHIDCWKKLSEITIHIIISMLINQKDLKDYVINSYCCNLKRKDHSGIVTNIPLSKKYY